MESVNEEYLCLWVWREQSKGSGQSKFKKKRKKGELLILYDEQILSSGKMHWRKVDSYVQGLETVSNVPGAALHSLVSNEL